MFSFPPTPPLEGMHPIIVHFPLGLLMVAWIPMLLCLIDKKRRSAWIQTALTMLVLGTAFTFAAVFTGEATEDIVEHSSEAIEHAIHEHEELAESARNFFIAITILFALIPIARAKLTKPKKKPAMIILSILVAISYSLGALTLANTGHQGGLLVHNLGIHAPLSAP
tara:strand:+ start:168206 stop:168706 length:501 start_codon:yes stop_codon:yes gene_type:complete